MRYALVLALLTLAPSSHAGEFGKYLLTVGAHGALYGVTDGLSTYQALGRGGIESNRTGPVAALLTETAITGSADYLTQRIHNKPLRIISGALVRGAAVTLGFSKKRQNDRVGR